MTVIELHPEFLTKDGKKEFAVLPYHEFLALEQWLEDAGDLLDLRAAREGESGAPTIGLAEVEKEFGIQ